MKYNGFYTIEASCIDDNSKINYDDLDYLKNILVNI